jgi:imidazolonepropionase-like amidohydrolase
VQNTRNLPFHAAFAAAYGKAYGFGRQEALESITIVPTRIFGLENEIGSIEAGKRATLFVSDGDPWRRHRGSRSCSSMAITCRSPRASAISTSSFCTGDPA